MNQPLIDRVDWLTARSRTGGWQAHAEMSVLICILYVQLNRVTVSSNGLEGSGVLVMWKEARELSFRLQHELHAMPEHWQRRQPGNALGTLSAFFSTGLAVSHCAAYWRMNSLAFSGRAVSHASYAPSFRMAGMLFSLPGWP